MNRREFLNEENYQKGKNSLKTIGIIIITIGILIGGFLIFNGINTTNTKNEENKQNNILNQQKLSNLKLELDLMEDEIKTMETKLSKAKNEKQKIFMEDNGFSDRYYEKQGEIDKLSDEILNKNKEKTDIKTEIWKIENDFRNIDSHFSSTTGFFYILPGIFVILASLMIGGSILLTAHQRNILAWQVQSVLPVAEETLEKVTPTIKKVGEELSPLYGTIAKEVTKGIKEGLKDEK